MDEKVQAILNALLQNPETRVELQKLIKKVQPDYVSPDLVIDEKYSALSQEIQKLREENEKLKYEQQLKEERQKIIQKGYNPEEVEKLMIDKGIAELDTAIEYLEAQKRLATPPSTTSNLQEINLKEMAKNNVNDWARQEALKALKESA